MDKENILKFIKFFMYNTLIGHSQNDKKTGIIEIKCGPIKYGELSDIFNKRDKKIGKNKKGNKNV